jgi:phosphoribosyl-AMP cyclohydrolase / phosphoribosyl-ATP pyrophosphohydrolase
VIPVPEPVFDERGLVPVVVQDRGSGDVLMVAWANRESLERSAATGEVHFWSRSRNALWRKGETSGNRLRIVEVRADCDRDTLLMVVEPSGPVCHTGARTCFGERPASLGGGLFELLGRGLDATLKKVGEEATEVVLAAKGESDERLAEEGADLLFHLVVALHQRGLDPSHVLEALERRRRGK